MNSILKKTVLTLLSILCISGCTNVATDNSDDIDALKAHMIKSDSSIKINPMAETVASLIADPTQQQEMLDEAKARYAQMDIKDIYLVTGATFESNETVIGSLVHFNKKLTLDEAKAQLAKDETFKDQLVGVFMNGNFAFSVATLDGKTVTPKSVITAFTNFN
ncbi:MAG: hypothetical protein KKD44_11325 [Proteobacteria bacterium]|nr:hypothetical protein [Pseudomonadota bacterium]